MNKFLAALFMTGLVLAAPLCAQDDPLDLFKQIDSSDADKKPATPPDDDQNAPSSKDATHISAKKGAEFDAKLKTAIFNGDVVVDNPQFKLSADKLTVYFKNDQDSKQPGAKQQKPAAKPAEPLKAGAAAPPAQQGGSIDRVIAEGNVVIESDRPDPKGGPPTHYVGKSEKLVYTPDTGEGILSGWPKLEQGINTMVATESSTVIYLNRDGKMRSEGGAVKMEVHDPGPDKTPAPDSTPASDKTPEVK